MKFDAKNLYLLSKLPPIIMRKTLLVLALLVFPLESSASFSDTVGHEFDTAITHVKQQGIVAGYDDGTFRPNQTINRAEFAKIIIGATYSSQEIENCTTSSGLTDVINGDWFARHVCIARLNEIIGGYPDGTFRPSNTINYAESAKILTKAFGLSEVPSNGAWYEPYTLALISNGASLLPVPAPNSELTRSQMAQLIYLLDDKQQVVSTPNPTSETPVFEPKEEDSIDEPVGPPRFCKSYDWTCEAYSECVDDYRTRVCKLKNPHCTLRPLPDPDRPTEREFCDETPSEKIERWRLFQEEIIKRAEYLVKNSDGAGMNTLGTLEQTFVLRFNEYISIVNGDKSGAKHGNANGLLFEIEDAIDKLEKEFNSLPRIYY